jgi:hypothetical protein
MVFGEKWKCKAMARMQQSDKSSKNATTVRKASGAAVQPDRSVESVGGHTNDLDLRRRLIREAAYHRYAERGYSDGHDVDDWLQAEAAVDDALANSKRPTQ